MEVSVDELKAVFLREVAKLAPQVIHNLFELNDAGAWLDLLGVLDCAWLQEIAEKALDKMRQARRELPPEGINRGLEAGIWRDACWSVYRLTRPAPLRIPIFDAAESYHYLTEDELIERIKNDPRIRRFISDYHWRWFKQTSFYDVRVETVHAEWLALSISGMNDTEIARGAGNIPESTVSKGRKSFSKLIGMRPRPQPGGRPRKTRN